MDALLERKSRITEVLKQVSTLEPELIESEAEAANAIEEWEQSYANLEEELRQTKQSSSGTSDIDERDSLLAKMTAHVAALNEQLLSYHVQHSESLKASKNATSAPKVDGIEPNEDGQSQADDITLTFGAQINVLSESDADANNAIEHWQVSYNRLEEDYRRQSGKLGVLQAERGKLRTDLRHVEEENRKSLSQFQEHLASATAKLDEAEEKVAS